MRRAGRPFFVSIQLNPASCCCAYLILRGLYKGMRIRLQTAWNYTYIYFFSLCPYAFTRTITNLVTFEIVCSSELIWDFYFPLSLSVTPAFIIIHYLLSRLMTYMGCIAIEIRKPRGVIVLSSTYFFFFLVFAFDFRETQGIVLVDDAGLYKAQWIRCAVP